MFNHGSKKVIDSLFLKKIQKYLFVEERTAHVLQIFLSGQILRFRPIINL